MNILAMDTSGDVLSLALSSPLGVRCVDIESGARHSELLLDWIDKLFNASELESGDLEFVVCMKGPGSFTGLRIGFAVAKGLSLALGIPIAAIPTLDCMSYALAIWPGLVLPVLDAKKNCFFAALYRGGKRLSDYLDMDLQTLILTLETNKKTLEEKIVITGPGAELFLSRLGNLQYKSEFFLDPLFSRGRSLELLQIAEKSSILNNYKELDPEPLYLRKSDAELNLSL